GGAPRRSVRLHPARHITRHTAVITAHVRVEGIVDVRERIRTEGVVDGHLADPEIVAGRSHVDAEQLLHGRLQSPNETLCPAAGGMGETTPILGVCAYSKEADDRVEETGRRVGWANPLRIERPGAARAIPAGGRSPHARPRGDRLRGRV